MSQIGDHYQFYGVYSFLALVILSFYFPKQTYLYLVNAYPVYCMRGLIIGIHHFCQL